MIEFKRNVNTGVLEAYKDGVHIGDIRTMADDMAEPNEGGEDND